MAGGHGAYEPVLAKVDELAGELVEALSTAVRIESVNPKYPGQVYEDVVGGEHPEGDVVLQAFDVVVVPKSSIANVNVFVEQYIARNIPVSPAWLALAF